MIQRIQTVYLLVSAILLTLMMQLPIVRTLDPMGQWVGQRFYDSSLSQVGALSVGCLVWIGLMGLMQIVTIFLYGHRKAQIRMCNVQLIMSMLLMLTLGIAFAMVSASGIAMTPCVSITFVPISLVLVLLAKRGVVHDERLVRSLDRIR